MCRKHNLKAATRRAAAATAETATATAITATAAEQTTANENVYTPLSTSLATATT